MSFHSTLTAIKPTSLQWVSRLVLPLAVTVLIITTSGCSMVMGILGSSEADITGVEPEPTRLLQPTPISQQVASAAERALRNGPTPTPFVMRPATQSPPSVSYNETNSATAGLNSQQSQMSVVIKGDAVNLRNGPGLDTQVVATKPRDTTFTYVDETDAGDWIQVCCVDDQLAWVYAELVTKAQASSLPLAQSSAGQAPAGQPSAVQTNITLPTNRAGEATGGSNSATTRAGNSLQTIAQTLTDGNGASALGLNLSTNPTRYTSAEDGYSITLPAGWLPLAESSTMIQASIDALNSDNPAMATMLEEQLARLGDIPISLIAFDLTPETLSNGFATNVNVMRQPVPAGFTLNYLVQFSAGQLERVLGLSDAAESTQAVLPAGETIILDYQLNDQVVARQYYLLHNQALYIVTFSASASLADSSVILFNELMQSFVFDR